MRRRVTEGKPKDTNGEGGKREKKSAMFRGKRTCNLTRPGEMHRGRRLKRSERDWGKGEERPKGLRLCKGTRAKRMLSLGEEVKRKESQKNLITGLGNNLLSLCAIWQNKVSPRRLLVGV